MTLIYAVLFFACLVGVCALVLLLFTLHLDGPLVRVIVVMPSFQQFGDLVSRHHSAVG